MKVVTAFTALALLSLASSAEGQARSVRPLMVSLDASHRSAPVTKYEYGMFIEPIGNLVARTLWAEMLDDRKFYFPVIAQSKDQQPPATVEGRPGATYRKWRPVGADDAVKMDAADPFVGKQSPTVTVSPTSISSIRSDISDAATRAVCTIDIPDPE